MKRKWDSDSKEKQQKCIDEIITRIDELGGSDAGVIAAQDIIDIVTENLAPEIYNKAINDIKTKLQQHFSDIEIDVDLLKQS